MGGIILTVAVQIVSQPVMTVFPSEGNLVPQVMLIAARTVNHLAEQPQLHHVKRHQLSSSEAAVLQEHERRSCPFPGFHQIPAVLQLICAAHLHGDRLSRFHRRQRDPHMILPGGGDDDGIHILIPDHIHVIPIRRRSGLSGLLHRVRRLLRPVLIHVADRRNLFLLL